MQNDAVDQLEKVMQSGTEEDARKFIVEHFNEFPPETQRELAVALFNEALSNDIAERETIAELKKQFVAAIEASEKKGGEN